MSETHTIGSLHEDATIKRLYRENPRFHHVVEFLRRELELRTMTSEQLAAAAVLATELNAIDNGLPVIIKLERPVAPDLDGESRLLGGWFCSSCGRRQRPEATRCLKCGQERSG